jgi:hypothetical protein
MRKTNVQLTGSEITVNTSNFVELRRTSSQIRIYRRKSELAITKPVCCPVIAILEQGGRGCQIVACQILEGQVVMWMCVGGLTLLHAGCVASTSR